MDHAQDGWQLHSELQGAADHRSPGCNLSERKLSHSSAKHQERGDDCDVPNNRRGVRKEKTVVAVQHAQTPGRHHQKAGSWKQDSGQANSQLTSLTFEAPRNNIDEIWSEQHSHQYD